MKKYPVFILFALVLCWLPHLNAFEGEDKALLARTISDLAEAEPEQVALMIGEVALNRMTDGRFADDLRTVLDDFTQFRRGAYASERSWKLAERLLKGERRLAPDVVYFEKRGGRYVFYSG
jgi:hypothetical protein